MFKLKKIVPTFLLLQVTSFLMAAAPYLSRVEFIAKYKKIAIREMKRAHIPASIILGQAILESDGGNSKMAREANNLFGIKCGGDWDGAIYHKKDDDRNLAGELINSCFRKYDNVEQSFIDHSDFLHLPSKPWYQPLFDLELTDYRGWAYGLLEAGYATNPEYPQLLINLIEKYHLTQFDVQSAVVATTPAPEKSKPVDTPMMTSINGVKCTTAIAGETVLSVAARTNSTTRQLIKYNDDIRYGNQTLAAGQIVFLHAKKSSNRMTTTGYHIVKEGDNMESIAQQYGIRLFWLYFKNKMIEGMEPAVGAKIKLDGITVPHRPELRQSTTSSKVESRRVVDFEIPTKSKSKSKSGTDTGVVKIDFPSDDFMNDYPDKRTHIVKKGDNLWSISKTYQVSVATLIGLNDLSHDTLSVGQVLLLE